MNWYKQAQFGNRSPIGIFPSDEDEAYFKGEDDWGNINDEKMRGEVEDERGVGESMKRTERWSKVYPHIEKIQELKEQLNNPNIDDVERKRIKNKIGVHTSSISNILGTAGKPVEGPSSLF